MAILERIKNIGNIVDFLGRFKKKYILKISDYLDPNLVAFLRSTTREEAIHELINVIHATGRLPNKTLFHKAITDREKIVSTGIGMGIAIPHAKMDDVDDFFIAIGIQKKQGLDWKSLDGMPVRIIFMIGGPESKQTEYLQLLSRLTIAIKDENIRRQLLRLNEKEEIIKLFNLF